MCLYHISRWEGGCARGDSADYRGIENWHYGSILIYEQESREVGVVMVPCGASRKPVNRPPAYYDTGSPFPTTGKIMARRPKSHSLSQSQDHPRTGSELA